MLRSKDILKQLHNIIDKLIQYGLVTAYSFPNLVQSPNSTKKIGISDADYSVFLKNMPYAELYEECLKRRLYHIQMLDGALITMLYEFQKDTLKKHRLSFFPNPDLEPYQNAAEIYEMDEIYADILDKRIVSVPLRFDYDADAQRPGEHPASHCTIGQYKNCRIPVSAPLTPEEFLSFIIVNFYHTASLKYMIPISREGFSTTILPEECALIHLQAPLYTQGH